MLLGQLSACVRLHHLRSDMRKIQKQYVISAFHPHYNTGTRYKELESMCLAGTAFQSSITAPVVEDKIQVLRDPPRSVRQSTSILWRDVVRSIDAYLTSVGMYFHLMTERLMAREYQRSRTLGRSHTSAASRCLSFVIHTPHGRTRHQSRSSRRMHLESSSGTQRGSRTGECGEMREQSPG